MSVFEVVKQVTAVSCGVVTAWQAANAVSDTLLVGHTIVDEARCKARKDAKPIDVSWGAAAVGATIGVFTGYLVYSGTCGMADIGKAVYNGLKTAGTTTEKVAETITVL